MRLVFGGGDFRRWLGHEGRGLLNGISTLIKETSESSLTPSAMWGHSEKMAVYKPCEEGLHQTPNRPAPWSWTSQLPEVWEINFCHLKATQSMVIFVIVAWMYEDSVRASIWVSAVSSLRYISKVRLQIWQFYV